MKGHRGKTNQAVAYWYALGYRPARIAEKVGLSPSTIDYHIYRLLGDYHVTVGDGTAPQVRFALLYWKVDTGEPEEV